MALGDAFEKSGFAEDLCDALADVKAPILSKLGTYIPPPRALDGRTEFALPIVAALPKASRTVWSASRTVKSIAVTAAAR